MIGHCSLNVYSNICSAGTWTSEEADMKEARIDRSLFIKQLQ